MARFHYIPNWFNKGLVCSRCQSSRSVKYEVAGKAYCNRCVLTVTCSGERKKFTVPVEVSIISYYDVEAPNAEVAEHMVRDMLVRGDESLLQDNSEPNGSFEVLTEGIITEKE